MAAIKDKKCMIIGAVPMESDAVFKEFDPAEHFVICADGGYDNAVRFGIRPDLVTRLSFGRAFSSLHRRAPARPKPAASGARPRPAFLPRAHFPHSAADDHDAERHHDDRGDKQREPRGADAREDHAEPEGRGAHGALAAV